MMQKEMLLELTRTKMPYGKYKDKFICELPEHYLLWHQQKGWPAGKLGHLLALMMEIRLNGLEDLIYQIKRMHPENDK